MTNPYPDTIKGIEVLGELDDAFFAQARKYRGDDLLFSVNVEKTTVTRLTSDRALAEFRRTFQPVTDLLPPGEELALSEVDSRDVNADSSQRYIGWHCDSKAFLCASDTVTSWILITKTVDGLSALYEDITAQQHLAQYLDPTITEPETDALLAKGFMIASLMPRLLYAIDERVLHASAINYGDSTEKIFYRGLMQSTLTPVAA